MDENKAIETGRVLIISATESFLAKSLTKKLEGAGLRTEFVHANIKALEEKNEGLVR